MRLLPNHRLRRISNSANKSEAQLAVRLERFPKDLADFDRRNSPAIWNSLARR